MTTLHDLGWNRRPESESVTHSPAAARPARVMHQGPGVWRVHDGTAELIARSRSRSAKVQPVTGDWVLVRDEGGTLFVVDVLPRTSTLSRSEAGGRREEQVLAANVDVVGVCSPADDVNPRRLERELTAVWSSGASPLVILTKADLVDDPSAVLAHTEAVSPGAEVVAVSSLLGEGIDAVSRRLEPGMTMVLIGPSGVGKSTLINTLAGEALLATAETRSDGKGRHTTTSRHLLPLPGGALLLDTPGMREFAPWVGDEGLAGAFADIEDLARLCRFSDCRHDCEPGCAVLEAAESDEIVAQRLVSWRSLQRELAWLERRNDARLMREERKKWTAISRSARPVIRP